MATPPDGSDPSENDRLDPQTRRFMRAFGVAERDTHEYTTLTTEQLDRLSPAGEIRETSSGEELFTAGADTRTFFVVLAGSVDILGSGPDGPVLITTHVAGQFLGELNLLIGQRP